VDVQQNGRKATRSSYPSIEIPTADEAGSEPAGAQPLLAAVAAVQAWEGEGGYTPQSVET
jgi:hypothetical protein